MNELRVSGEPTRVGEVFPAVLSELARRESASVEWLRVFAERAAVAAEAAPGCRALAAHRDRLAARLSDEVDVLQVTR